MLIVKFDLISLQRCGKMKPLNFMLDSLSNEKKGILWWESIEKLFLMLNQSALA